MRDLYIERQADYNLYNRLSHGEYSYILSPLHTGKTHLLCRVKKRLKKDEGIKCATIYLKTDLRKNPYIQTYLKGNRATHSDTPNYPLIKPTREYYWQCISELASQFKLLDRQGYRNFRHRDNQDNNKLPDKELLPYFINNILLKEISQNEKIVIFVDEIDELCDLYFFPKGFAEDFFNTISYCYEHREDAHPDPKYLTSKFNRLTFALFGEECAWEIVKDYNFNFHELQRIRLEDFRFDDLSKGTVFNLVQRILANNQLSKEFYNEEIIIREIFNWTNGQPLLTNKLLTFFLESDRNFISKYSARNIISQLVKQVVSSIDVTKHLKKIDNRLLAKPELLQLYQDVLQPTRIRDINRPQTQELLKELISLGLIIITRNGYEVHNHIYEKYIFHSNWIQRNRYRSYFLLKNRTYLSMSSSNQQPPEPQRNQNLEEEQQQSPENSLFIDHLPSILNNVASILIAVTILSATYFIVYGSVIIAIILYTIAIYLLIAVLPNKNNARKKFNQRIKKTVITTVKLIEFIINKWPIFLLVFVLLLYIVFDIQIRNIRTGGNDAQDKFNKQRIETEALEYAVIAGNNLNKKKLITYIPHLRNKLPNSPLKALQYILLNIHEKNRLISHDKQKITAVKISPNGEKIITGDESGILQYWDKSGNLIKIKGEKNIVTNVNKISSLGFSFDGTKIAIGGDNGLVEIYDLDMSKLRNLPHNNQSSVGKIRSINFSQDGNFLITGGSRSKAYLWNLIDNNNPLELNVYKPDQKWNLLKQERGYIRSITFSPDYKIFAVAGANNFIKLFDLQGQEVGHSYFINSVISDISFDREGTKIALVTEDGLLELLTLTKIDNQEKYQLNPIQSLEIVKKKDNNPFFKVSFDNYDNLIVIVENNNKLQYFKYLKAQSVPEQIINLNGYDLSDSPAVKSADFNNNNNLLITAGDEKKARIWDLKGSGLKAEQKTAIINTKQNVIKKISTRLPKNNQAEIATLGDNVVKLWSKGGTPIPLTPINELERHGKVTDMNFTPKEDKLATVGEDGVVRFWNLKGQYLSGDDINTKQGKITSISFSPDGQYIAVADETGTINRWKLKHPSEKEEIANNQNIVDHMSFSPDGQSLVTLGNNTPKPQLWDLSKLQESRSINSLNLSPILKDNISDMSFSHDGFITIATDNSNELQFFTSSGEKKAKEFKVQQEGVVDISFSRIKPNLFSPHQPRLATAGTDRTIKVWDWFKRENEPIAEFKSDLENITSISLSPDGTYVVVGGDDGIVEVWTIDTLEDLLKEGCKWLEDYHSRPDRAKSNTAKICQAYL